MPAPNPSAPSPGKLARTLRRLYGAGAVSRVLASPVDGRAAADYSAYRNDPVGFATDVLGVTLTPDQCEIARGLPGRVKVNSGHNVGKGHPVDLVIDTPSGKRRFGDLQVGDHVFGLDGTPTEVTGVFPRGRLPLYRVTMDDGSSTLVDGDHLWRVRGPVWRKRRAWPKWAHHQTDPDGWEVLPTSSLLRTGTKHQNGVSGVARTWEIPRTGAVAYEQRDVPVPAYTMGVWLGDGTCGKGEITTADDQIVDLLGNDNPGLCLIVHDPDTRSTARRVVVTGLVYGLREAEVAVCKVDGKRVPSTYMENSADIRLAVLQGLMDSDGTVGRTNGSCSFGSTSRGLVEDVAWLVRSLGGKAFVDLRPKESGYKKGGVYKRCRDSYSCAVRLPGKPLFRLTRKQDLVPKVDSHRHSARFIDSIEPAGEADVVCISVAAPDSMYLANDFIPTHNTMLAAVLTLWWFYTRDPSVVVTTGPTKHHVDTVLWTEIRLLIMRAAKPLADYLLPKAAKLFHHPDHWAEGLTASSGEGFHGRHRPSMLFVFDECEDVDPMYWSATDTMYQHGGDHGWMAIGNPYTTASQSYLEDMLTARDGSPKWRLFTLSALNHPNIAAELAGLPPPVPNAVSVAQVDQWVRDRCTPVPDPADRKGTDVEWPPAGGKWYRPGPLFLAGVMGLRPTGGVDTVWSEDLWALCLTPRHTTADALRGLYLAGHGISVGVDASGYGDDDTVFHVRCGPLSLHHEARNGWGPDRAAGRLKELCREWAHWYQSLSPGGYGREYTPYDVGVTLEFDGGYGIAVHSHRGDYHNWGGVTVGSGATLFTPDGRPRYYNMRSQIWCEAAARAAGGGVDLSRLPREILDRLRLQLLTPFYEVLPNGARSVEAKAQIKVRLKRSPDDADGFLVSHHTTGGWAPTIAGRGEGAGDEAGRYGDRRQTGGNLEGW